MRVDVVQSNRDRAWLGSGARSQHKRNRGFGNGVTAALPVRLSSGQVWNFNLKRYVGEGPEFHISLWGGILLMSWGRHVSDQGTSTARPCINELVVPRMLAKANMLISEKQRLQWGKQRN